MVAAHQIADRVGEEHAAGDTGSRAERALKEAATASLRSTPGSALLRRAAPRATLETATLRRRGRILLLTPWRTALWRAALRSTAPGAALRRLRRARRGIAAAKQRAEPAQKAAALGLLGLRLKLLDMRFEFLQAVIRGAQRLLLHQHGLGKKVRRVRLRLHSVGDKRLGFLVAGIRGSAAGAVKQTV